MASKNSIWKVIGWGSAAVALYGFVVRPWHRTWGAASSEFYGLLPGDDLVPRPRLETTHAVTIAAPPAAVWPWLAQIGQGRGGFYSYALLENLMGLDMHNADRILPAHQDVRPGDVIPLAPGGFGLPVAQTEPERLLVLHGDTRDRRDDMVPIARPSDYVNVSWGFYLFPEGSGTRLVERWRADYNPSLWNRFFYPAVMEPGAFIMQRSMLLGIKRRAETGR